MKNKRITSLILVTAMIATSFTQIAAAGDYATRGEVCDMLIQFADDYNANIKKTDILKGYQDGSLNEEGSVTGAEALVMLKRAFGDLGKATGHNARVGYPAANFTDIPAWAATDLQNIFDSGIVAGTSETTFSPSMNITKAQMELFIDRTMAFKGSNLKDDFYATVNKAALDKTEIKAGGTNGGTFYDIMDKAAANVANMIKDFANNPQEAGSPEETIATLYNNSINIVERNKAGITPIKPYLDAIDKVTTLDELMTLSHKTDKELNMPLLVYFSSAVDAKNSNAYISFFSTISPSLNKEVYLESAVKEKAAYINYMITILKLGGVTEAEATEQANAIFDLEAKLSEVSLQPQEQGDIDKIYNLFTMKELKDIFTNIDLDAVLAAGGYKPSDKNMVADVALLKESAKLINNENIDVLKAYAKISILSIYGGMLNEEFTKASNDFMQALYGVTGAISKEETGAQVVGEYLQECLEQKYIEKHFTAKAKADVTDMVKDIIEVYKERINKLDWMSDITKKAAIDKLNSMSIKVGYPDKWANKLANVKLKTFAQGGSYFDNIVALDRENIAQQLLMINKPVDKSKWTMSVDTVNAAYIASFNEVIIPAGILQAPMYDVNASRETNLGAIGYIIAHEITHAFDNNGAKFDKNGNATDWWTKDEYAAFEKLCVDVIALYDQDEATPGIRCNGTLTLSENIADLGGVACMTDIVQSMPNGNFKELYESLAKIWASSMTREFAVYASQVDLHAQDKLRVQNTITNFEEFFKEFGITEKDAMYVAPEDRVKVW